MTILITTHPHFHSLWCPPLKNFWQNSHVTPYNLTFKQEQQGQGAHRSFPGERGSADAYQAATRVQQGASRAASIDRRISLHATIYACSVSRFLPGETWDDFFKNRIIMSKGNCASEISPRKKCKTYKADHQEVSPACYIKWTTIGEE